MATITINVSDEINEEFRRAVKLKFGEGKGIIGKAIETAIGKWLEEYKQKLLVERQMKLMKEGIGTLNKWKFKREELYNRI